MKKIRPYLSGFLCGLIGGMLAELAPYCAAYLVPGSNPYRFLEEGMASLGFNPVISYFSAVLIISFVIFLMFLFTPWGPKSREAGVRKAIFYILNFIAWDIGMIAAVGLWALGLIALFQFGNPMFL